MGGDRQHVLPKFLLKGFSNRTEGNKYYTWVYRKNAKPFETNIINVGVFKGFYSQGDDSSTDDVITDMEGVFAADLEEIRQFNSSTDLKDTKIAEFTSHLEIRTQHVRNSFHESFDAFASEFIHFLRNTESGKQLLLNNFKNDPSIIKNALEKQLKGQYLPPYMKDIVFEIALQSMPYFLDQYLNPLVDYFARELPKIIPSALKDGHLRALKENSTYEVRKEKYQKLCWKVYVFEQDDLILGDCGVIFEVDSSRRFKTFWENNDKLKAVFSPISGKHLIVGTQVTEHLSLDLNKINRVIAECSREFFISGNKTNKLQNLQTIIGTNSYLLTDEEIKSVFKDWIVGK